MKEVDFGKNSEQKLKAIRDDNIYFGYYTDLKQCPSQVTVFLSNVL
jgi:hypothetical protein